MFDYLQEKLSEAEEATRQKVEDMKVKGEKYKDDVARKASEAQNTEAERYIRGLFYS